MRYVRRTFRCLVRICLGCPVGPKCRRSLTSDPPPPPLLTKQGNKSSSFQLPERKLSPTLDFSHWQQVGSLKTSSTGRACVFYYVTLLGMQSDCPGKKNSLGYKPVKNKLNKTKELKLSSLFSYFFLNT